jgi:hypothetical protein
MICGFCGREIAEEVVKNGCGGCPMAGGCRKICCPHCGYENPVIPKLLQKLMKKKDR